MICAAAWAVPGAGHLWQGRMQKGLTLLVLLPVMFAIVAGLLNMLAVLDAYDIAQGRK